MKIWNKIKEWALREDVVEEDSSVVAFKETNYPPKINLAWGACLQGDEKIIQWMLLNGYIELVKCSAALYGNEDARKWLMDNNYPQLMALIQGAEKDMKALHWLKKNNFILFYNMALAIAKREEGVLWVNENCTEDILFVCKAMYEVQCRFTGEDPNDTSFLNN